MTPDQQEPAIGCCMKPPGMPVIADWEVWAQDSARPLRIYNDLIRTDENSTLGLLRSTCKTVVCNFRPETSGLEMSEY